MGSSNALESGLESTENPYPTPEHPSSAVDLSCEFCRYRCLCSPLFSGSSVETARIKIVSRYSVLDIYFKGALNVPS